MNVFIFLMLAIGNHSAHASCTAVPGRDGQMEAQVCTQEQDSFKGESTPSNGSTWGPNGGGHYNPSPNTPSSPLPLPSAEYNSPSTVLPAPPTNVSPPPITPPSYDLLWKKVESDRIDEMRRSAETDANIASASTANAGANAITIMSQRATEKATRDHFVREQAELEQWERNVRDGLEPEAKQFDVLIQSEFTSDRDDPSERSAVFTGGDGLIKSDFTPNGELRQLRRSMKFRGVRDDYNQSVNAKLMNRILGQKASWIPDHQIEGFRTSVVLTLAADEAAGKNDMVPASELIHGAKITVDLALGFVPIIGAVNDATQIIFGMLTGYDYTGNRMASADYALRSVGFVFAIGGRQIIRFGALTIGKANLTLLRTFPTAAESSARQLARDLGVYVNGHMGTAGVALAKVMHYRMQFSDNLKFRGMMTAITTFKDQLTHAGHALIKHPMTHNYSSAQEYQRFYRGNRVLNEMGEKYVERCLKDGKKIETYHFSTKQLTYDYVLKDGYGSRFLQSDHTFITFVEP